ncbi:MAG: hypothetical protein IAF02_21060 [Anaerolineae bacterium]|nr:hypothetical protein [Anaerolineae bacterium]
MNGEVTAVWLPTMEMPIENRGVGWSLSNLNGNGRFAPENGAAQAVNKILHRISANLRELFGFTQ